MKNLIRLILDLFIGWLTMVTVIWIFSIFLPKLEQAQSYGAFSFAIIVAIIIMFLADKYLQKSLPDPKKK